tara:strand:- start:3451 stop:4299 length:849 start_codon:yes stop_codon:yes gene_type:complete
MTESTPTSTGASLHHSFDIHLAKQLGSVELAILVHHFAYWVDYNTRSKKNYHDGKFWTYQTIGEIANHFPYLSKKQVERYMKKLTDQNILVKGNYNKTKFDRTVWYTFSDEWSNRREKPISRNREMEEPEPGNQSPDIGTPIPHTKTYTKTHTNKEYSSDPKIRSEQRADFFFSSSSGKFEGITEKDKASWKIAYPAIDMERETIKAEQWLKSNPSKAKKKLWRKFLVGWFSRANDKTENQAAYRSNTGDSIEDCKFRAWEKDYPEDDWEPQYGFNVPKKKY